MTGKHGLTRQHAASLLHGMSIEDAAARLQPDLRNLPDIDAGSAKVTHERAERLWKKIGADPALRASLLEQTPADPACYQGNIENFIGLARIPIGLAGPLRVNGLAAKGDFPIPLATTEAALAWQGIRTLVCESPNTTSQANEIRAQSATHGIRKLVVLDHLPLDRRHQAKIDYPALKNILTRKYP